MKSYPHTQFDIVNNTAINQIQSNAYASPTPLMMQTYTSDKGSEGWEIITSLSDFTASKGGLNFARHGQSQLLIAEVLRAGGVVYGKRLVSDDAKLANVTIKATIVVNDGVSYVYYSAVTANCSTFEQATKSGYDNFDPDSIDVAISIPLFTIAAVGRGSSNLYFRIVPEYYASKNSSYTKFTFEVIENNEVIESILFAMNPDVVSNSVNQSLETKVNNISKQVKCKIYEDGFIKLVTELAKTAKIDGTPVPVSQLANLDFINAYDKKGTTPISGIVTQPSSTDTVWQDSKPDTIKTTYILRDSAGVALVGGSYGTLGSSPMSNPTEYEKLLLGAWGANQDSPQFSPVIYDLDNYKVDAIIDNNYPMAVKNAIINLVDFRGDCTFLVDLGMDCYTLTDIIDKSANITKSRATAIYHNFYDIVDPFTKKRIKVTHPFLLASRLVSHIANGVGRPFAGIANSVTFPEIIEGSVNFLPVVIPGANQKQQLVDANINYISYYDGLAVMETMYTNDDTYSQLSFLHNVMAIQEVIKAIRSRCPQTRYTFLDENDLEAYIEDATVVINRYKTNFKSISISYEKDEKYEENNIFYATITVTFNNFINEEYFRVIAVNAEE